MAAKKLASEQDPATLRAVATEVQRDLCRCGMPECAGKRELAEWLAHRLQKRATRLEKAKAPK